MTALVLRLAADTVVLLHLAFVLFVALGGWWVWRRPRLAWLHLPAVGWGALIEFTGRICPLTPLENHLRQVVGAAGYAGGFIDHYLWPLLYPVGLTREMRWALGAGVLAVNGAVYGVLLWAWARARARARARVIGVKAGAGRGRTALALWLAVSPAAGMPPPCRIERSADALHRLEVWGRELAGAKGVIAAHSARRVAWVADRRGAVIEALFLVTLQAAGAPGRPGASVSRPQWVRCTRGETDRWR